MRKKSIFVCILFILMLTMVPVSADDIPLLMGLDEPFGPNERDANGDYTSWIYKGSTIDFGSVEDEVLIPWLTAIGFTKETSSKEAIRLLAKTGLVYIHIEADLTLKTLPPTIVIEAFLKDNPDYFVMINYNMKDQIIGSELQYHSSYYRVDMDDHNYEKLYKDQFSRLSELEKYACAFSSSLTYMNSHSLYTYKLYDFKDNCAGVLDGWNIHNREELFVQTDWLFDHGHHGSYNRLKKLYEDNTPLSVLEIAEKYLLDNIEIMRLFYIEKMKDTLGEYGIEAWDYGRALNLFRWSYEAGYITKEEALAGSEPFVTRIRNHYSSWEDFMAHYIAGRGFWTLTNLDVTEIQQNAVEAAREIMNDHMFNNLYLEGFETNANPVMKLSNSFYYPATEAYNWNLLWDFFRNRQTTEEKIWESYDYIETYPSVPAVRMMQIREFFSMNLYSQTIPLFRNSAELFQPEAGLELSEDSISLFNEFWGNYMCIAASYRKSDEALYAADMFELHCDNPGLLEYERGVAWYYKIGTAPTQAENDAFKAQAASHIQQAVAYGYGVSEGLLQYLEIEK